MTDAQLCLAIGIPSALFALNFIGVLASAYWQAKRFEDMKDLFKSEINRVGGVLSAKLDGLSDRVKTLENHIHSPLVKN